MANIAEDIKHIKLRPIAETQALSVCADSLSDCTFKEEKGHPTATYQSNLIGKEQDSKIHNEMQSSCLSPLPDNSEQVSITFQEAVLLNTPIRKANFTEQIKTIKLRPTLKGQALSGFVDSKSGCKFKEERHGTTAIYQPDQIREDQESKHCSEMLLHNDPPLPHETKQVNPPDEEAVLLNQPMSRKNFTEQIRNVKLRPIAKEQRATHQIDLIGKVGESKLYNDIALPHHSHSQDNSEHVTPPSQETVLAKELINKAKFTEQIRNVKLRPTAKGQSMSGHDDSLTVHKLAEKRLDDIATYQPIPMMKKQESNNCNELLPSYLPPLLFDSTQVNSPSQETFLPNQLPGGTNFTEQIRNVKLRPTPKEQALCGYADFVPLHKLKEEKFDPTATYQPSLFNKEKESKHSNTMLLSGLPLLPDNSDQVNPPSQETVLANQPMSKENFTEQTRNVQLKPTAERQPMCDHGSSLSVSENKEETLDPPAPYQPDPTCKERESKIYCEIPLSHFPPIQDNSAQSVCTDSLSDCTFKEEKRHPTATYQSNLTGKEQDSKIHNEMQSSCLSPLPDNSEQVSITFQEAVLLNMPIRKANFTEQIKTIKLRPTLKGQALSGFVDSKSGCKFKEERHGTTAIYQPDQIREDQESKHCSEMLLHNDPPLPHETKQVNPPDEEAVLLNQPMSRKNFTEQIRNVKLRPIAKEQRATHQIDLIGKVGESKLYNDIALPHYSHSKDNSKHVTPPSQETVLPKELINKAKFAEQIRNVKLRPTAKGQSMSGHDDSLTVHKLAEKRLDDIATYQPLLMMKEQESNNYTELLPSYLPPLLFDSTQVNSPSQETFLPNQLPGGTNFTEQIRNVKLRPTPKEQALCGYADFVPLHKLKEEKFDPTATYQPSLFNKEKESKHSNTMLLSGLPLLPDNSDQVNPPSQETVLANQPMSKENFTEQTRNVQLKPTAERQPMCDHGSFLSVSENKEEPLDPPDQPDLTCKERESKIYYEIPLSHFPPSPENSEQLSSTSPETGHSNQLISKANFTEQNRNGKLRPSEKGQPLCGYADSFPICKFKREKFVASVSNWPNLIGKKRESRMYDEMPSFHPLGSERWKTFTKGVTKTTDSSQILNIADVPRNIKDISVQQVADILRLLHMHKYIKTFVQSDIDGQLLVALDVSILSDLGMSPFHATKLHKFIHEDWRPKTE